MFINWKLREINLKIVYYGPSLSGKTTSLEYIHSRTNPERRGELISLKTREDRTLYFDYMQFEMGTISGLKPRFNIYTVPGQWCERSVPWWTGTPSAAGSQEGANWSVGRTAQEVVCCVSIIRCGLRPIVV